MTDIENKVFDTVCNAVQAAFPGTMMYSKDTEMSATYPAGTVVETDNVPVLQTSTDDNSENHARLSYEINFYSDKQTGAKRECRDLMKVADTAMKSLKFRRIMARQLDNIDRTLCRMYARYEVIVGEETLPNGDVRYNFYRRV